MIDKNIFNHYLEKISGSVMAMAHDCDKFGRSENVVNYAMPFIKFLYERYFRVTLLGKQNLKRKGAFIIAANHSGTIPYDAVMLACAMKNSGKRDLRFLADKFAYKLPFVGILLRLLGALPAGWDNAYKLLEAGHPVMIFPEGVRGIGKPYERRYRLSSFSKGFARLAKELKVPIIPAGIVGAEEIHPVIYREETIAKTIGLPFIPVTPTFPWLGPLGLIPLPTKWVISFGKPIKPDQPLNKIVSRTRTDIQKLISNGRRSRKSIWE